MQRVIYRGVLINPLIANYEEGIVSKNQEKGKTLYPYYIF
jgi:hypothetical protein